MTLFVIVNFYECINFYYFKSLDGGKSVLYKELQVIQKQPPEVFYKKICS